MENKDRNYKRIITIALLLFIIIFFIIIIIYELTKKGFTQTEIPSTEKNYEWYEDNTQKDEMESLHENPNTENLVVGTETVAGTENQDNSNDISNNAPDSDSYARREWFKLEGIPEEVLPKLNIDLINNNMQDMLYSQGYSDYTVAKYDEHEENDSYIDIWFTVDTKPNVTVQVLYYRSTDTAIVRLYDEG